MLTLKRQEALDYVEQINIIDRHEKLLAWRVKSINKQLGLKINNPKELFYLLVEKKYTILAKELKVLIESLELLNHLREAKKMNLL